MCMPQSDRFDVFFMDFPLNSNNTVASQFSHAQPSVLRLEVETELKKIKENILTIDI